MDERTLIYAGLDLAATSAPEIEELELTGADGSIRYVYIAKIDGKWVDLKPYGNRLPQ